MEWLRTIDEKGRISLPKDFLKVRKIKQGEKVIIKECKGDSYCFMLLFKRSK